MRRLLGMVLALGAAAGANVGLATASGAQQPEPPEPPVTGLEATLSHPDLWWGEPATVTVRSIDPCFDVFGDGSPGTAWIGVSFRSPPIYYPAPAGPDGQWVYEYAYDGMAGYHRYRVSMICLPTSGPDPNTGDIEGGQSYDELIFMVNPRPEPTPPPAEEPPPVEPATPVRARPNVTG